MKMLLLALSLLASAAAAQSYTITPIANDFYNRSAMINAFGSGAQPLHFGEFKNPATGQPDTDEGVASAALLFNFTFFGATYSQVQVSTNGLVSFSAMTSAHPNHASSLPDAGAPNNFIAALWKDLGTNPLTANSQSVLYMTDIGTGLGQWVFHLLWQNWPDQGTSGQANENHVVISLYQQSGDIEIHYGSPAPWGVSAAYGFACGIENATGTEGIACPDGWLGVGSQGRAFRFSPASVTAPTPLSITTGATLPVGTEGTAYSLQLTATGGIGPYTWADAAQTTVGLTLPAGWSLGTDGVLTAPASAVVAGTFHFDIAVSDQTATGYDTRQFTVTIDPAGGGTGQGGIPGGLRGGAGGGGCSAGTGSVAVLWLVTLFGARRRKSA